ncbi:MAG: hypothetical protein ABIF77_10695 [bacterium]
MSTWYGVGLICLLAVAGAAGLTGCATYSATHANLRPELASGQFDKALQTVEENRGSKDELLYYLERGLILHYADRWQESNQLLQQAEDLAVDLYTKSISEGAFSLFTNDTAISYRAEPFEMAMIPYYRTLNYIYLGEKDEAMVEARKASLYLQQYADLTRAAAADGDGATSATGGHLDGDSLETLRNNAFLQYLSGMLYEWDGEINDAFIAYRNAASSFAVTKHHLAVQTPPWLGEDLARTGNWLGFSEELELLWRQYPELAVAAEAADPATSTATGHVVLFLEFGYVAHKIQREFNLPILKDEENIDVGDWAESLVFRMDPLWSAGSREIEYWLRVAMPEMVAEPPSVTGARVTAGVAGSHTVTVPVEDLAGRAVFDFQAKEGTILLKSVARALSKYLAKQKADDVGVVAGIIANIFGAATETADTRSWLTLPGQIALVRLELPPGQYDLQVELFDQYGQTVATESVPEVNVRARDWHFASRRAF